MTTIAEQFNLLHKNIGAAEIRYGRAPGSVKVLVVTKNQSIEKIQDAIAAGQQAFGENYLQEALSKITAIKNPSLEWHFIGHIQSNKTKEIANNFAWVHSIDRLKIAIRLNKQRSPHLPPLNVCIEVNTSGEETKSGIPLKELLSLAASIQELPRLKLRGLMTIPAPQNQFDQQRIPYHTLKISLKNLQKKGFALDTLSMGMSNDFEAAIAEGSTILRIGTFLFGKR